MTQISNDNELKNAISDLDYSRQRELAGRFVDHVITLSHDERVARVVKTAMDSNAGTDELASALQTAKAAAYDCHTRCGHEGDWKEQAGYFVARAAMAAVTPEGQCRSGGPAWQAAMSCRMARTCELIGAESDATSDEAEQQYRIATDFINT